MRIVRIMRGPGDSITRGERSPGSGGCWGYLPPPSFGLDLPYCVEWVGSQVFPDAGVAAFLGPHEGYNALSLSGALAMLPTILAASAPDVCCLMLGTNDMSPDPSIRAAAPGKLEALLDAFPAGTWVIVGTIPTIVHPPQDPAGASWVYAYNAALTSIVKARRAAGRNIVLAQTGASIGAQSADGVHPSDAGYASMAGAYRYVLDRVLPALA